MTAIFSHQPDTYALESEKKIFLSPDSNPDWPWVQHLIPQNLSSNNNNKLIYPPQGVVVRIEWTKYMKAAWQSGGHKDIIQSVSIPFSQFYDHITYFIHHFYHHISHMKQTVFVNKTKPWLKVVLDMLLILNYYMNFNFLSYFPNPQSHHFFVSLSYIHTYMQRVRGIFVFSMISESLEISVLIVCTYSTDFQRLESINMFFLFFL